MGGIGASITLRSLLMSARKNPVWLLMAALAPAVAVYLLATVSESADHEARALIVAQEMIIATDELPGTASVIFNSGGVAQRAVRDGELAISSDMLIPSRARLEVMKGTIALQVVGSSRNPEVAATYANATAEAFAERLNASGGIGTFEVFEPASAAGATRPAGLPKLPLALLAGLVGSAGLLIGLHTWHQPMNSVTEIARTVHAPLMMQLPLVGGVPPERDMERALNRLSTTSPTPWEFVDLSGHGEQTAGILRSHIAAPNGTPGRTALLVKQGHPRADVEEPAALAGADLGAVILLVPSRNSDFL